jgi:hypothetical protein
MMGMTLCRVTLIAALALTLQLCSMAGAEEDRDSGNAWHRKCTSENVTDRLMCTTYLEALSHGLSVATLYGAARIYCIPQGVTVGQMRKVVIRSLEQHPQDLHTGFSLLAVRAFRDSFPCPDTETPVGTGSQEKR